MGLETHNGKLYIKRECPNVGDGKPYVYHDLTAQLMNHGKFINWDVRPEGEKYRCYAGSDPSPMLFDTADEAWIELDQVYCGNKDWDEDS